jgi:hypothetical protein
MAAREYDLEIAAIDATLVSIEKVLDLPKLRASAIELEAAALIKLHPRASNTSAAPKRQ